MMALAALAQLSIDAEIFDIWINGRGGYRAIYERFGYVRAQTDVIVARHARRVQQEQIRGAVR